MPHVFLCISRYLASSGELEQSLAVGVADGDVLGSLGYQSKHLLFHLLQQLVDDAAAHAAHARVATEEICRP